MSERKEKFTPGPWVPLTTHIVYGDAARIEHSYAVSKLGTWLALAEVPMSMDDGTEAEQCKANANLIAAAPELYEALEGVLRVAGRQTVEFDAARAALAKARGEA